MGFLENKLKKTHELLRMGEKNSHNRKQLWEDGIKLEPWIFKRMDKICRKNSSLVFKWRRETPQKLLRYFGRMTSEGVEPTMKNDLNLILEKIWLMKFILTSNFEKNLGMAPRKLEESGKILGKDLWVRAHSKENTVERFLKRDCTGWIKWLEWDNNLKITWTD